MHYIARRPWSNRFPSFEYPSLLPHAESGPDVGSYLASTFFAMLNLFQTPVLHLCSLIQNKKRTSEIFGS